MIQYSTADSRLASYLTLNGVTLEGTEIRNHGQDDKVLLRFLVEEANLARLKREFFESEKFPALELLNEHKRIMFIIREARELSRESLQ